MEVKESQAKSRSSTSRQEMRVGNTFSTWMGKGMSTKVHPEKVVKVKQASTIKKSHRAGSMPMAVRDEKEN